MYLGDAWLEACSAVCHTPMRGRKRRHDRWVDRDLPASPGSRVRSAAQEKCMPGPATALELTAKEVCQLTACVRAGTTPQRLVRRARLILGSAAGMGSRALARQERMSRTTVRRWLGRFATERCAGLQDRPRTGRPKAITPVTRALVVALACERPADRAVPLRRYSLSELTVEIANRLPSQEMAPSRTAIWRWLAHDALRPWRFRSWISPHDPHFLERAGPVLDL